MVEYKQNSDRRDDNRNRLEITKYVANNASDISRLFDEIFDDLELGDKLVVDRRKKR